MRRTEQATGCRQFYRASWPAILSNLGFGAALVVSRELFAQGAVSPGIYSWLVAIVPVVLGAVLFRSYVHWMRALDEWWIRIYFRALAFSFGVTIIVLLCYPILELANAPALDPIHYAAIGILVFGGAAIRNARKFS